MKQAQKTSPQTSSQKQLDINKQEIASLRKQILQQQSKDSNSSKVKKMERIVVLEEQNLALIKQAENEDFTLKISNFVSGIFGRTEKQKLEHRVEYRKHADELRTKYGINKR